MKLGEALVREGLITRQQLDLALQRQVLFGGRIGTNLVELKFLGEDTLTDFLGRYFGIPPVTPEMMLSIEGEVLHSVSNEIIRKYTILPLKKEHNRLHAALLNPADSHEIGELSRMSGFDIIPYALAECRLLYAREHYYGLMREPMHAMVTDSFNPETEDMERSINKIKISFAEVKETEEIAGLLVQQVQRLAARAALFIVRDGNITGWKGRGLSIDGFETTGEECLIFSDVLKRRSYYRGPVLSVQGNEPLIKVLSGSPQDALLLPINIREKTVALLYADNGSNSVLNANVGYLSRLASMAALAYEMLMVRNKILAS